MAVADAMAARSKCVNRKVGSVIVNKDNRPVSVGYNGAPAGFHNGSNFPVCAGVCPRGGTAARGDSYDNCISVHAEANALIFADRRHYEGGTIYVTNPCCWDCAKLIANSGIARVVVRISEADSHADYLSPIRFMSECGVHVSQYEERAS